MKMNFLVLGVRRFNDLVEGQKYDFTKLVVVMDMPQTDNAKGQNSVDIPYGTHENFAQFDKVNFPAEMEIEVNMTTKGLEALSVRPLPAKV